MRHPNPLLKLLAVLFLLLPFQTAEARSLLQCLLGFGILQNAEEPFRAKGREVLGALRSGPDSDKYPIDLYQNLMQQWALGGVPWAKVKLPAQNPQIRESLQWMNDRLQKLDSPEARARVAGIKLKIKKLLTGEQRDIEYDDWLGICGDVSFEMDAQIWYASHKEEIQRTTSYTRGLVDYPGILFLPTPRTLSFDDFQMTTGLPIHFVGMTDKKQYVDGMLYDPEGLPHHDVGHALIAEAARSETGYTPYEDVRRRDPKTFASGAMTAFLNGNAFRLRMNDQVDTVRNAMPDNRARTLFDAAYFFVSHEWNTVSETGPAPTLAAYLPEIRNELQKISSDKAYLGSSQQERLKALRRSEPEGPIKTFFARINERRDLGQAFKTPPSEEEVIETWKLLERALASAAKP